LALRTSNVPTGIIATTLRIRSTILVLRTLAAAAARMAEAAAAAARPRHRAAPHNGARATSRAGPMGVITRT
jgi:hypothetical protein